MAQWKCPRGDPPYVGQIVDDCIRLNLPALWLQLGVVDAAAAQRAVDAGITVVMEDAAERVEVRACRRVSERGELASVTRLHLHARTSLPAILPPMLLRFTKMHGLGNDFIVFDAPADAAVPDGAALRQLADRRTGIGFDQALVLLPPRKEGTDVYYRIFNADGSEVEQCGNGARCVGKLVAEKLARQQVHMDSLGGPVAVQLRNDGLVSVDMGVPDFNPAALGFDATREADIYPLRVGESELQISAVSMGNPHAVMRVQSVGAAPVDTLGPAVENHARFANRTNVGFMEVVNRNKQYVPCRCRRA